MEDDKKYTQYEEQSEMAHEPVTAATYGMSETLINSGLLAKIRELDDSDRTCLIRYLEEMDEGETAIPNGMFGFYTDDPLELEARIAGIERSLDAVENGQEDSGEWMSSEDMWNKLRERHSWLR